MKKVAILQSNYIPWKGYFDIINDADLFIFYDSIQYTKNDWRNRNRIKTPAGTCWLTIPTGTNLNRLICEVTLNDLRWPIKHWKTIMQYYSKSPHFKIYQDFFEHVYLDMQWNTLSELNQFLIKTISNEFLGIKTEFKDSCEYTMAGDKNGRLVNLLQQVDANYYISGPAAKDYIDEDKFRASGIELVYKDYSGYPEYPQLYPPFDHYVSVTDLLFNTGPDAPYYIWGWREAPSLLDLEVAERIGS